MKKRILCFMNILLIALVPTAEVWGGGRGGSFSIGSSLLLWEPVDIAPAYYYENIGEMIAFGRWSILRGFNLRYMVRDNWAIQGEIGMWNYGEESESIWESGGYTETEEEEWELTCLVLGGSCLYLFNLRQPEGSLHPAYVYVGGGISRYGWTLEYERKKISTFPPNPYEYEESGSGDDVGFGFHALIGIERRIFHNFYLNGEVRIITGKTRDWKMDYSGGTFGFGLRYYFF